MRLEENQNGRSYAVSDTVLADAAGRNVLLSELDAAQQEVSLTLEDEELMVEWRI